MDPKLRNAFFQECLDMSNHLRQIHKVPPQQFDTKLGQGAQIYAEKLARTNNIAHSYEALILHQFGENIGCIEGNEMATPLGFIYPWYSEVHNHKYDNHPINDLTGHFTQLIWKTSTRVGFGLSSNGTNHYLVANYLEVGNRANHYMENVFWPENQRPPLSLSELETIFDAKHERCLLTTTPKNEVEIATKNNLMPKDNGSSKRFNDAAFELLEPKQHSNQCLNIEGGRSSNPNERMITQEQTVTKKSDFVRRTFVIETIQKTSIPTNENARSLRKDSPDNAEHEWKQPRTCCSNSPDSNESEELEAFVNEVLDEQYLYRKKHGVKDLMLNEDLRVEAQRWAELVLRKGEWQNNDDFVYKGKCLGVAAAFCLKDDEDRNKMVHRDINASTMVKRWYETGSNAYKIGTEISHGDNKPFGNMTQMIWKSSEVIGIGKARSRDKKKVSVVCFYHPPGNIFNEFRENVLPLV